MQLFFHIILQCRIKPGIISSHFPILFRHFLRFFANRSGAALQEHKYQRSGVSLTVESFFDNIIKKGNFGFSQVMIRGSAGTTGYGANCEKHTFY